MGQTKETAIGSMLVRHRLARFKENRKSASEGTMQNWHQIVLLHYGDLLEMGDHLRSLQEFLPEIHHLDRHHTATQDYLDQIKAQPDHVIFDDAEPESSLWDTDDPYDTSRIPRSVEQGCFSIKSSTDNASE